MDVLTISYCIDALRISKTLHEAEKKMIAMMHKTIEDESEAYQKEKEEYEEKKINGLLAKLLEASNPMMTEELIEEAMKTKEYQEIKNKIKSRKK